MEYRSHGLSDIGCAREENQDSLLICEPIESGVLESKGLLVVVADGMGGLEGGALASRLVSETMERCYYSASGSPSEALKSAAEEANRIVFERSQSLRDGAQMGSTLTAACFRKDAVHVVQVGDSRAYHARDGDVRQVTKDHSLVQELVERRQVEMPAAAWSAHRNVVTRGMGLFAEVEVDAYEVTDLLPGDVILISSDGFHELVSPEEMASVLRRNADSIERASEEFVALARERGAPDNITVALVEAREPVHPAQAEAPSGRGRPDRYGWPLPLAVFLSFALGVLLTIALDAGSSSRLQTLEELGQSLSAPLRQLERKELDDSGMRELQSRLETLEQLLRSEATAAGGARD